jgi:MOSC domain-containing protein YiiM
VPLTPLIGREVRIGEAVLRGVEISAPCHHLVEVTGIKGVLSPLLRRGGLHAAVVSGGVVRVSDPVVSGKR